MNLLKTIMISMFMMLTLAAHADPETLKAWSAQQDPPTPEDFLSQPEGDAAYVDSLGEEAGRDPAAIAPVPSSTIKRNYPGGGDEEDLRVLTALPEAALKTDTRTVQRDVYKNLYNQELKDDRQDAVEE